MRPREQHAGDWRREPSLAAAIDRDAVAQLARDGDAMGVDSHLDADGKPRLVERRFVVEESMAGFRLDHYLKRKIPRLSRTRLQQIIAEQVHWRNGRQAKPSARVRGGEEVVLRRRAAAEPPCPRRFAVLYQDPYLLVINKPAGLPCHGSAKFYFNTLTRVLADHYPGQSLQICHRLDRETSGALVVARGKEWAAALKQQFAGKAVRKRYLAIVHGAPSWADLLIDRPLGLVDAATAPIPIRMAVRDDAQPAQTRIRVLKRRGAYALVSCEPLTGRQHQIRAHLAAVGFPIVGDKLYAHGDEAFAAYCERGLTAELLAKFQLPRHALHAHAVAFRHPATGRWLEVKSPLEEDLARFFAAIDRRNASDNGRRVIVSATPRQTEVAPAPRAAPRPRMRAAR